MADTDSDRDDMRIKAAMFDTLAKAVELAPATLLDRLKSNRLNKADSDKVLRLIQVLSAATDLFGGDGKAAQRWLTQPVKGLGGQLPIEMIATSDQTNAVLDLIGRLEHGVLV